MICDFCYRHCDISEGGYGYCQARTVRSGQLEDRNYGELAAAAIDPVEKKPLYHFLPGTRTLSVAMEGCSLSCAFCQNHEIAKGHHEGFPFTAPETLSEYAITHSIPSLSFTYTSMTSARSRFSAVYCCPPTSTVSTLSILAALKISWL